MLRRFSIRFGSSRLLSSHDHHVLRSAFREGACRKLRKNGDVFGAFSCNSKHAKPLGHLESFVPISISHEIASSDLAFTAREPHYSDGDVAMEKMHSEQRLLH
jgi:hypothetical protein